MFHSLIIKTISKPAKKYETNKTVAKHIDNIWSLELLEMIDYGVKNNRGCRYNVIVFDNLTDFGLGVPLETKAAQTKTKAFYKIIHKSNQKSRLIETDVGKKFEKQFLQSCYTIVIKEDKLYRRKGNSFC